MADNEPQTEIPDSWVRQFKQNVVADPTARKAWDEIGRAGLEEGVLLLLWGYAGGADSDITKMHRRSEYAGVRMKAAVRAERVAKTSKPQCARNADLFRQRALHSLQDTLKTEWPIPNAAAGVRTVGDELALASELKGRDIPLDGAQHAMVRAAGRRSPVNRFRFLFLLQGYAASHGVTLGNKRLIALAHCADPDCLLDEGTLGRYLRDIPESVREGDLINTLPTLPPPRTSKEQTVRLQTFSFRATPAIPLSMVKSR